MSEFIAEAQVLVVPNTEAFAATLRTQLEAAVAKAGPVVVPVTAAPVTAGAAKTVAAETAIATKAIEAQSVALQVEGAKATQAAVSQAELAAAERASARAHAQATRGIAAEGLALAGLRGATLAASAPFLVGATAAIVFSKSIKEASDATEEFNKTQVVFGESAKQIEDFSKTTATALGISSTEALRAAGIFGNLFRVIDISQPRAAQMSETLVRLASDLASFNNADPSRVLEALRSGLVGQARPLRVFGIFISQARAQQEALIETGKKNINQLTQSELVQARFNIILRDSNIAAGDFARTQDRLANQSRILKAQLADLSDQLGQAVLPAVTGVVGLLNDYVATVQRATKGTERFASALGELPGPASVAGGRIGGLVKEATKLYFRFALLGPVMGAATLAEKAFGDQAEETTKKLSGFHFALGGLQAEIAAMQATQEKVDFKNITNQLKALETERLKIQTGLAPGGRPAEEANLQQQIELDKKAIAQAASGSKARADALNELKSDQQDLASLMEQDAQDIQDASSRQKKAAQDAAQAQADATQAFIDSFSGRQGRLQNRLTSAQLFGTAKQQIAINKLIVAADKAEINAIKDRIRHLKLHGEALKIAQNTIEALNQEIFNTRNAIAQLQAERQQAVIDARQSHLEAQLAIAETTKSTKDDVAAEKALIKFDQAQIRRILAIKRRRRLTQDEAAQLDAYRVDLAQRNAELRKTQDEQKKGNQTAQEFFNFLQTQAGFAANLLGNLIPGGATSGLVGGTANAAAAVTAAFGQPGGPQPGGGVIPGMAVTAAAATSRDRGVRPIQVDTTNQILRHILRVLQHQTGRMGHPEARFQKHKGNSDFDGVGGN